MKNYQGVTFEGSTFPDQPYSIFTVHPNSTITAEYSPTLNTALPQAAKGLKLLCTAICIEEGFKAGTLSYQTHNPGNIGNTDNGVHRVIDDLAAGIQLQVSKLQQIASGQNSAYPMGHEINIHPFFIPHAASMGLPDWAPGYHFTFTGQLDQFVKIYSTGARCTNNYINVICSYFAQNGLAITPTSKLQDIIAMK